MTDHGQAELTSLVSIDDALARACKNWPTQVWVVCGDQRRTFAEADTAATAVAGGLAVHGIGPGDRVAVICANRIESADLFVGLSRLGAVAVPLNIFLKGSGLAYQLADAGARAVVADREGLAAVKAVRGELVDLELVIALDPMSGEEVDVVGWADLLTEGSQSTAPAPANLAKRSDLHSILYTSGTTGSPKGCMLPVGYYLTSSTEGGRLQGYTPQDVILTALPLYHGFARGALMSSLLYGSTVVVEEAFSPAAFLERARTVGATVLQLVGAMAHALLEVGADAGDAGTKLRMTTAIPLDHDRARAFEGRFGGAVQTAVYGQTETGGIALSPPGEGTTPGTLGRPAPNFEVQLVDDEDRPVADGEVGEIVVRPKAPSSIYLGYWRRPEDTARAWRNLWHHTGDLARRAPDGTLTFVDRAGDALRRRGENVSSVSVEQALLHHPAILEAAVHAVASEATEDDIKACIVLASGASITPEEVFQVAAEHLPYFAVPRYLEVLDELPRTVTMRVRKHVLRSAGVTGQTTDLHELGLVVDRDARRTI